MPRNEGGVIENVENSF